MIGCQPTFALNLSMRTVKSYANLAEAGFASSLLEAGGIRTLLADEQSSLWSYGMAIPIRLQVDDADFEKAHQITQRGPSLRSAPALAPVRNSVQDDRTARRSLVLFKRAA
jgi:hypothetical protein